MQINKEADLLADLRKSVEIQILESVTESECETAPVAVTDEVPHGTVIKGDVERDSCELILDTEVSTDSETEFLLSTLEGVSAELCAGSYIEVEGVSDGEKEIVDT